jgi:hypothetical protein
MSLSTHNIKESIWEIGILKCYNYWVLEFCSLFTIPQKLENTSFGKSDLFSPSGERGDTYSVELLRMR